MPSLRSKDYSSWIAFARATVGNCAKCMTSCREGKRCACVGQYSVCHLLLKKNRRQDSSAISELVVKKFQDRRSYYAVYLYCLNAHRIAMSSRKSFWPAYFCHRALASSRFDPGRKNGLG